MVTKAEQRDVADQHFREQLTIIRLRAWPPLAQHEREWQVEQLRALADKRSMECGELEMAQ